MSEKSGSDLKINRSELFKLLEPLLNEYLKEIKLDTTAEEYLNSLAITPIVIDKSIIGFWGLTMQAGKRGRKLATVKAFYIKKDERGKHRNRAADDLIKLLLKEGVTDLEIWAYPEIQKWLEERYNIKTNIYVTFNPIEKFKVF